MPSLESDTTPTRQEKEHPGLKLALELDANLASRDKALLGAAATWGVTVHDLRNPGDIE